ncbi:hypothetical protein [Elizabethkingia anophelis]|uniref:hypothetical protein n=1 Tax=Elizabethkingia anophelis TaxID=1117645 RepID=UPI0037870A68
MRNLKTVANNFIPKHEKEWDARLFVDEAIKSHSEIYLEIIKFWISGSIFPCAGAFKSNKSKDENSI